MSATAEKQEHAAPESIPADARAVLRIDLNALRWNWKRLNEASGRAECSGVIKADAYGLGLEQVARALAHEGCRTFFTATLEEGRRVRAVEPGAVIYILDGLLPGAGAHYSGFDLRPCLSSLPEIREWAAYCRTLRRRLPAAIHIDTGINRLGLATQDVDTLAAMPEALVDFDPALVMSHLACADEPENPYNADQRRLFDRLRAKLPAAPASLANSGGVFLGPDYHYDLVRPGIALYGGRALEVGANPMRTVVRLSARILQVREVAEGEAVGYGATYRVTRTSRIATIACGYADGFLRALSGLTGHPGPAGYLGPHPVPTVGRVSMDLITVDVTDVPAVLAQRGAWVEVMGERVTLDDLTDRAGTIGYELLSRLSRRVHRIYEERDGQAG